MYTHHESIRDKNGYNTRGSIHVKNIVFDFQTKFELNTPVTVNNDSLSAFKQLYNCSRSFAHKWMIYVVILIKFVLSIYLYCDAFKSISVKDVFPLKTSLKCLFCNEYKCMIAPFLRNCDKQCLNRNMFLIYIFDQLKKLIVNVTYKIRYNA